MSTHWNKGVSSLPNDLNLEIQNFTRCLFSSETTQILICLDRYFTNEIIIFLRLKLNYLAIVIGIHWDNFPHITSINYLLVNLLVLCSDELSCVAIGTPWETLLSQIYLKWVLEIRNFRVHQLIRLHFFKANPVFSPGNVKLLAFPNITLKSFCSWKGNSRCFASVANNRFRW